MLLLSLLLLLLVCLWLVVLAFVSALFDVCLFLCAGRRSDWRNCQDMCFVIRDRSDLAFTAVHMGVWLQFHQLYFQNRTFKQYLTRGVKLNSVFETQVLFWIIVGEIVAKSPNKLRSSRCGEDLFSWPPSERVAYNYRFNDNDNNYDNDIMIIIIIIIIIL